MNKKVIAIMDAFEELLDAKGIEIPCANKEEQSGRHDSGNDAKLYGTEFGALYDTIEQILGYKEKYIGKDIQLYPSDTYKKYGKILDVDDLGWIVEITNASKQEGLYAVGDTIFISHSKSFTYKIIH